MSLLRGTSIDSCCLIMCTSCWQLQNTFAIKYFVIPLFVYNRLNIFAGWCTAMKNTWQFVLFLAHHTPALLLVVPIAFCATIHSLLQTLLDVLWQTLRCVLVFILICCHTLSWFLRGLTKQLWWRHYGSHMRIILFLGLLAGKLQTNSHMLNCTHCVLSVLQRPSARQVQHSEKIQMQWALVCWKLHQLPSHMPT